MAEAYEIGVGIGGSGGSGEWSHGLFGCFGDLRLCLITYFVPCYIAGKNAEAVDEDCLKHGIFSVIPIVNIVCGMKIRRVIRERKNIQGTDVNDCLMHSFCALCAIVQEGQELKTGDHLDQVISRK